MNLIERVKHIWEAFCLTITGITISQLNTYLGAISLLLGISYQIWKWRKESKSN